jgi:hypothetical protein
MSRFSFKRSSRRDSSPKGPSRKARPTSLPVFETMEGRQLMSATTVAEVNWNSPTGSQTVTYEIGSNHQVYESTGDGTLVNLGGQVSQISAGLDTSGHPEVYATPSSTLPLVEPLEGRRFLSATLSTPFPLTQEHAFAPAVTSKAPPRTANNAPLVSSAMRPHPNCSSCVRVRA